MKNKYFSQKLKDRGKHFASKIILSFILLLTFTVLSPTISANSAFRVENCNKCEEYAQKLGKEINEFIALDTDPKKTVSTQVTSSINEYRKKIIDLQSHPDVEKRSLENEILLAYVQGNAAGRIAWIYYYNIYTFTQESSVNKINAKYAQCKATISNSTQSTVLSAECEVMLDELNRLIYTERAKNLALPNDSLTSAALISGTVEKFKETYSADLFAAEYSKLYSELTTELGLQRVRDALKSEAELIFNIIRPNESFSDSSSASLLIYELKNAQSVKAMNSAALDFVKELLAIDEKKPYSATLKGKYLELTQTAASRGTENQTAASISPIFSDYPLSVKKAEVKDSVYAILLGNGSAANEKLLEIEQKFNADGGIIDNCKNDSEVESELINAKSALFLYKHGEILNKPFDEIGVKDEDNAKKAIIEYCTLEKSVKQRLLGEINIIAEKYNIVLVSKIRSYLPNDALYLDFCEIIIKEIKSISRESIDDFYNISSKIPQKAEALYRVMMEYRAILASSNYSLYNDEEKQNLLSVMSNLSSTLDKIDPADVAIYADEISDAQSNAIRSLNVIDQCARVRIATRSSKNAAVIEELKTARQKISLCSDKSEMILQANRAIYKIERLLTGDAIISFCEQLKADLQAMEFLTKDERDSFCSSVSALSEKSKDAESAENISALEGIWNNFSSALLEIRKEAEAIDLSRAISVYVEKITSATNSSLNDLKSLAYISKDKCDEIYNSIKSAEKLEKEALPSCKSTAEVVSRFEKFLEALKDFSILSKQEDLKGYKIIVFAEFDKYEQIKANYSVENYNKILAIKNTTSEKLNSASSKSECDTIASAAHSEILSINDLLDDEKDIALARLLSTLEALKKDSPLYSKANFSKIEGLYDEAKIEIGKINDISNIAEVKQTLSKYITLISAVRKDSIYTSESAHVIATPSLQYPNGYNYASGLLGSVHLSNGLMSDARLSITLLELSRNKQVEEFIRYASKHNSLVTSQKLSSGTLKLLRSSSVAATLDISLSSVAEGASGYTLQILIPNEIIEENILGLAFVNGDTVEFYPVNRADSLISAKLEHFSKYYIVVESTLNVQPLLIALIILLIIEFLVLIGIIYLRYKRKDEEVKQAQSDLPELPMSALIPFSPALTRVLPENGVSLAVLLSIAAIALASTIALLIHKERKENKARDKQILLNGRKNQPLLGKSEYIEDTSDVFFTENESKKLCSVGAYARTSANKAEIDLDTISASFESGEIVNLQSLKNKGLVDENTEYIKILAKGNLIKPLTVEANEFSNAAKNIVELSGGKIKTI